MSGSSFRIGDAEVGCGCCERMDLPVARLFTGAWLSLPVTILHGVEPGPALWLDAAVHGDEINGVEIIRRVLEELDAERLAGTVVAVPVVNVFGFTQQSRYLPDRRDLNRSFPGSKKGSLTARLARLFVDEIVSRCDFGIDFHTGSLHRTNLAQVRADLRRHESRRLAEAFAPPFIATSKSPRGSLRGYAEKRGIPAIVFEGGEPLRFDDEAIREGVAGVWRVLAAYEMVERVAPPPERTPFVATRTSWVRADRSGVLRLQVELGAAVGRRDLLGWVGDPFSPKRSRVRAPATGIVIGHTNNPLVHQGDALVHLGFTE
jgi:predicted deacylase